MFLERYEDDASSTPIDNKDRVLAKAMFVARDEKDLCKQATTSTSCLRMDAVVHSIFS